MLAAPTPVSAPTPEGASERELPPPAPKHAPPITVIAEGTAVGGRVEVRGDLRVDGAVEGTLLAAGGSCEVSAGGSVAVGTARAAVVAVHGVLHAEEVVARRVVVTATGELRAQVVAADAVEVETGGKLDATLEVGRDGPPGPD